MELPGPDFLRAALSRRCVIFLKEQVIWSCHCAEWFEETNFEELKGPRSFSTTGRTNPQVTSQLGGELWQTD
jgi:hypothetical protein